MTGVDPERVARASAAWNWYPPDARVVETEEFLLVRFPEWFFIPLQVQRFTPTRPTAAVMPEVLRHARDLGGSDTLSVWVKLDAPDDLEPWLVEHASEVTETVDVFAAPIGSVEVPAGTDLRWVHDVDGMRDFDTVSADVFGGTVPDEDRLARSVADLETEDDPGTGRLTAYLDGRAVAVGGLSVSGNVARLWGGAVLPGYRGRGLYRALLAERMRRGAEHGCDLALVKGRVETSGPILRRAGFATYGQERQHALPLPTT